MIIESFIYRISKGLVVAMLQSHPKNFYENPEPVLTTFLRKLKSTENTKYYFDLLNRIYTEEESKFFIDHVKMFDVKYLIREIIEESEFDKVRHLFKSYFLDMNPYEILLGNKNTKYNSMIFGYINNNRNLINTYKKLGINVHILNKEYFVADFSKFIVLGTGANGIALLKGNQVFKFTISDYEVSLTKFIKSGGMGIMSKHFCEIYKIEELHKLNIIVKEYVDGNLLPGNENDPFYDTTDFINFSDHIENELDWGSYIDLHPDNGVINPKGKNVKFMYFDY